MKYILLLMFAMVVLSACKTEIEPEGSPLDDAPEWDEIDEGTQADDSADELIEEPSDLEIADDLDIPADSDIDNAVLEAEAELEDW